jgi:NADPH:quinone reductase-like Zn-dependent oxidoreductase
MSLDQQNKMDAVVIVQGGPPQSLVVRTEPVPVPGPGEVLVEVHAAAINPLDIVNAQGLLGTPLPVIPGADFAGVVVSEGSDTGREVWGCGPSLGMAIGAVRQGTHARFVAVPAEWLSTKPAALSMAQAAAVGRSHWAAWEALVTLMGILPGETVLITGGGGMVGRAASDIAHWRGADVIIAGTHGTGGGDAFIDTRSADLHDEVMALTGGRGVDLALDTVGAPLFDAVLRSLRFDGRMVGFHGGAEPATIDLNAIYNKQLRVTGLASVFTDGAHVAGIFDQLRPLFDRGVLTAPAVRTWPLAQAADAYQTVIDGSAGVKQVLLPGA